MYKQILHSKLALGIETILMLGVWLQTVSTSVVRKPVNKQRVAKQ